MRARAALTFVLLVIGGFFTVPATSSMFLRGSGGASSSGGTPTAVGLATTFPVVYDTSAATTVVSGITVTMSSGSFSGTLAFATAAGSDLVIDGTTATLATSASHAFADIVGASDLVMVANDSTHNSISSPSHSFVSADALDWTGRPTIVRIQGGSHWNAGNGACPTPTVTNGFSYCAWAIACTGGNTGACPPLVTAPATGVAQLMQTGSSGSKPLSPITTTFNSGSAVITSANTLAAGEPIKFVIPTGFSGTLPANFVLGQVYFVIATGLSSTQFEVSATLGGSALVAADAGTGTRNGLSQTPGTWDFIRSTEVGLIVTVTGGSGCTTGDYRIIGYQNNGGAIFDRALGTAGSTCAWTMTYDGGGQYAFSGSNLVVATLGMNVGDATDNVKIVATQNAVSATSAFSPINRVGQQTRLFVNLAGPMPNSIYDSGFANGYALHYSTSRGAPPTTVGGSFGSTIPQWNNKGGDCADASNAHVGACPPASGTAYSTATPTTVVAFTMDATALITDALAVSGIDMVDVGLTVSTSFHTISSCVDTDATKRPRITYHYTTGSDKIEQCVGTNDLSTTETYPRQVTLSSPMSLTPTSNVGISFPRPDSSRTLSTATLNLFNASGTPTISLWRLVMPYQNTADVSASISDSYVQDGCPSGGGAGGTCTLANDSHIIFYFEGGETLSTKLKTTSIPDYTNAASYDYTVPGDVTKIPQYAYPFGSPSTAKMFTGETIDPTSHASILPTVVCAGSFSSFGYAGYAANMPCAWEFTVNPNQEIISDLLFPLNATTDGVQPGNGRTSTQADGQTISSGVLPAGQFPQTVAVRALIRWSNDWFAPDNASLQMGGKNLPGFGHLSACGNGGASCGTTQANGTIGANLNLSDSGRVGWFIRGDDEQPQNPSDPFYRKQIFGDYTYWTYQSQVPYFFGPKAASRDQWVCVERRITMNSIVRTSPTTAAGARPISTQLGTGYVNGEIVTPTGGAGVAATYTVTTDGSGHVQSLAQTTAGTYTTFPITTGTGLPTTSNLSGTGLKVEMMPVDTSSADGVLEAWMGSNSTNAVKLENISGFKFRGTPPFVPATATFGGTRPNMYADGGVREIILNYFLGGVYGGWPGTTGHWFIKSLAISDGTRIGCPKLS